MNPDDPNDPAGRGGDRAPSTDGPAGDSADPGIVPLSRFTALLARPRGSKRMDALLSRPDPAAAVAELPVQDLYCLVQEVGLADATELVELATAEQFQGFLDMAGWSRDSLDPADVRPWLQALLEGGFARTTEIFRELDPELAALILARHTRIYNLAEEELPEDEEPPFFPTPDRFFMVKITAEDPEDIRVVERLLDYLYRGDAELARHLLRAAAYETTQYLEETAYRFRQNRMAELGYADFHEAIEVYRPLDPAKVAASTEPEPPPAVTGTLPAVMADASVRAGFLGKVLARIVDPGEAARVEAGLVTLFNKVLAADVVDPGDLPAAARGSARAAATLSLGLETVARGQVEAGLAALRSAGLVRLHRAGVAVLQQLAGLVKALGRTAHHLDEPYAALVAALREPRPSFPAVLDTPPGTGTRPFATLADVRRATELMAHAGAQVRLVMGELGAEPGELGPATTIGDLGRTAVVHALLGRAPTTRPLTPDDVASFVALGLAERREPALSSFGREYAGVVSGWLADLEAIHGAAQAAAQADDPLDPRRLGGLVVQWFQ